jgi:hypothetical protein
MPAAADGQAATRPAWRARAATSAIGHQQRDAHPARFDTAREFNCRISWRV